MTIHWPFPGDTSPPPVYDLPPARFSPGDRVESRWGWATVIEALDWPGMDGSRKYLIHHDWSGAPDGFGHLFEELHLTPLAHQPLPQQEQEPVSKAPSARPVQADLFEELLG
jgi:hypothetical protein